MIDDGTTPDAELDKILDDVAYELTQARAASLDRPDAMRGALKRAADHISQADALISSVAAARRTES